MRREVDALTYNIFSLIFIILSDNSSISGCIGKIYIGNSTKDTKQTDGTKDTFKVINSWDNPTRTSSTLPL